MEKIELIGKYVGPLRIINVRNVLRKTYLGRDIVEIEFANKEKKEYPAEDLKTIATKEPTDLSTLRQLEIAPVATSVLGVLVDSELPIFDPAGANIQYLLQTVLPESIQESTRMAYGKLFNKDYGAITLFDIDKVLKKDGKSTKENKKDDNRK